MLNLTTTKTWSLKIQSTNLSRVKLLSELRAKVSVYFSHALNHTEDTKRKSFNGQRLR